MRRHPKRVHRVSNENQGGKNKEKTVEGLELMDNVVLAGFEKTRINFISPLKE